MSSVHCKDAFKKGATNVRLPTVTQPSLSFGFPEAEEVGMSGSESHLVLPHHPSVPLPAAKPVARQLKYMKKVSPSQS